MTDATVSSLIAELEAIGRARALTDAETRKLAKLVSVEPRYRRPAGVRPVLPIGERILRTLERLHGDRAEPRAIYLRAEDADALGAVGSIAGVPVRRAAPTRGSVIYSTRGVAYVVRRRG